MLLGILFGLAVGFALAFVIAQIQHGYYFQIILPGSLVGVILGYVTQRYGGDATTAAATRAPLPR
jgi:predicted membrane protein